MYVTVVQVCIGIVSVFALMGIVCSGIGDRVSEILGWRAQYLEKGIRDYILQGDQHLLSSLYSSPLISMLPKPDSRLAKIRDRFLPENTITGFKPQFIPSRTFVLALFDTLVPGAKGATTVDQLISSVVALAPTSPLRDPLLGVVTRGDQTVDQSRANIEAWFDGIMDRVSQTYKRHMWLLALLIGITVSALLNVDTLSIGTRLWRDAVLRNTAVNAANQAIPTASDVQGAIRELSRLNLPIGWDIRYMPDLNVFPRDWLAGPEDFSSISATVFKVIGWIITGFAGAQGAPFWFDLLRRLTGRQ